MTALAIGGLTLLVSYLFGALPFGYLIARWRGVDIFHEGSGNIGATNVGRVLGRCFGTLVFLLDFAKGALPTAVASWIAAQPEFALASFPGRDALPVGAGLAAFVGHLFPVYLRFHGGKGVATGAGVVTVLLPVPALGALLVWVAFVCALRIVSLASVVAAVTLCALRFALTEHPLAADHRLLTLFCLLAAGLVIARHRANIGRLFRGTENQLQDTPTMRLIGKIIHVIAIGLWFGSVIFFTFVAALSLFGTFQSLAEREPSQRPNWFPPSPEFENDPASWKEPHDRSPFRTLQEVRREQGTRAAGAAVGPMFDWYFLLQGACGLLAVATALSWSRAEPQSRVHRIRTLVLLIALFTVVAGWPLEREVSKLRDERNAAVDAALRNPQPPAAAIEDGASKVRDFGLWHAYSLFLNFGTLALVTVGMGLTARLPGEPGLPRTSATRPP